MIIDKKYRKDYSESKLWIKIKKVATIAGMNIIYPVLVLYYLLKSPYVSPNDKLLIIGTLGYFIAPIDLIPDAIPGVGYVDDLAAIKKCIDLLINNITPDIKEQAHNKLKEWFGDNVNTFSSDII